MTELSPQARELIDGARGADDPTAADLERVRQGLYEKLGTAGAAAGGAGGPGTVASATSASAKAGGGLALKVFGAVVLTGALGIGGYLLARGQGDGGGAERSAIEQRSVTEVGPEMPGHGGVAPVVVGLGDPDDEETEGEAAPPPREEPRSVKRDSRRAKAGDGRAAPQPRPGESTDPAGSEESGEPGALSALREEQRLIAAAQAALRGGEPGRALEVLQMHAQRFSQGVLAPERVAARVVALCDLEREDEARSEAASFLARWPRSPLASRVRSSCGGN